jgi:hypothetical protein
MNRGESIRQIVQQSAPFYAALLTRLQYPAEMGRNSIPSGHHYLQLQCKLAEDSITAEVTV